jgi:hypothetical protein
MYPFWLIFISPVLGSALNTGAERQRYRWKRRPENAGHLYTGGLFAYARHINYFGDQVLFTGWALITGRLWLFLIPASPDRRSTSTGALHELMDSKRRRFGTRTHQASAEAFLVVSTRECLIRFQD